MKNSGIEQDNISRSERRRRKDRRRAGVWSEDVERALRIYARLLFRHGVSQKVINGVDHEARERLFSGAPMAGRRSVTLEESAEYGLNRRHDFFGRAVLFKVEFLFPKNGMEEETIIKEQIEGEIPRQMAAGVVEAVRSALSQGKANQYGSFFNTKAERYQSRQNGDVDIASFGNDGGVRSVSGNIMNKMADFIAAMSPEEGRAWLKLAVEGGPRFSEMERPISDQEYETLRVSLQNGHL